MKTLNLIENALPKLESVINNMLNTNFDLGLKVTESLNRRNEVIYEIESAELKSLTGPIGEMTYKSYKFSTWGGQKVMNENKIWFNPKFFFTYNNGGSNGTDAFWHALWFDLDTNDWVFGRNINE
jgi:hypothetical protein